MHDMCMPVGLLLSSPPASCSADGGGERKVTKTAAARESMISVGC